MTLRTTPMELTPHPLLPSSLYKYTTVDSVRRILFSQSLQWAAPHKLNDIFDVAAELSNLAGELEICAAVSKRLRNYVSGKLPVPPDIVDWANAFIKLYPKAQAHADYRRECEAFLDNPLAPEFARKSGGLAAALEDLDSSWRKNRLDLRLLCLSATPDNTQMWHFYAGDYSGAVLEFETLSKPNLFRLFHPVVYEADTPLSLPEEWADLLLSQGGAPLTRKIFKYAIYYKTPDWTPENEWRMHYFENEPGDYSYNPFLPRHLTAIYFGPRMKPEDKIELTALRDARYPTAKIFHGAPGKNRMQFHLTK